jgi:hypothetical protein
MRITRVAPWLFFCTSLPSFAQAPAGDEPVSAEQTDATAAQEPEKKTFGEFTPGGPGFKLADTRYGDMNFSAWGYVRYLNQKDLDETYTDSFGRTKTIDPRNDLQLNKVNLYFKGWIYDPAFTYFLFAWTQNASQGEAAQVVIGGNLGYQFSDKLNVGGGISQLPGVRTLRGTFPYWNRVDARMIADEFFRPSYTTALYAFGDLGHGLDYKVVLGNNMSQLGVSATQLDGHFNTLSGSVWWAPRGDYGPAGGYGDFEHHEELVTQFGLSMTRSREDRQSQPSVDEIENSQIRLSDGTRIFEDDAFATGGRINRASYLMTSFDAGFKYRGFELAGELYDRHVDDFATEGFIPVQELNDHGFQFQASMMVLPRKLQVYLGGSKVYGEYGDPYDLELGINWYPFGQRLLRWNTELMYLENSPVGYPSVPFVVGGNGTVFETSLEMVF